MNSVRSLARRPSPAGSIASSQGTFVSSDNPLPAFLAFLAEDTKVGERTARQYVAHLQRFAAWLEQHYQAALLEATMRDLRQYKTELGTRQSQPRSTPPWLQCAVFSTGRPRPSGSSATPPST